MITRIRNSRWVKTIAMVMIFQILFPLIIPPEAHAITGGPSQPEFSTFTPVGVSDMVNPFTGDFSYNIPLMDVGGYPINISYSSGVSMEQQATSVGLGWTLNAGGAVTRSMRGIPDDFNGSDEITTTTNLKHNTTVGASLTILPEVIGLEKVKAAKAGNGGDSPFSLSLGFGVFHNSYSGVGFEANMKPSYALASKNGNKYTFDLGLSANSKEGIGVSPRVGLDHDSAKATESEISLSRRNIGLDASYNSRAGLRSIGIETTYKKTGDKYDQGKHVGSISINRTGRASIPIGLNTYIPQIGNAMRTTSVAANIGTGLELLWVTGKMKIAGYFNRQALKKKEKEKTKPAYGFLYADKGKDNPNAMHDFNREKDGAFTRNTPALPMTQMTYDIYTVSGQGVGGMFRPHRDFATVYDPRVKSDTGSGGFGGDLGAGGIFKGGFNLSVGYGYSKSGKWSGGNNQTKDQISFNGKSDSDDPALYEPFYMKAGGEFTTFDQNYFDKIQGFDPVRIEITKMGKTKNNYWKRTPYNNNETLVNSFDNNKRTIRDKRNQTMTLLPAGLAQYGALDRQLIDYDIDLGGGVTSTPEDRVNDYRKAHHISEIAVDRPDGARYIYGNQTYNIAQKEVSFNAAGNTINASKGTVEYSGDDNSTANDRGIDNFYSSTELPPYATAYLLTTIVSPDYVDLDGDGATADDLGTYTKFNYRTSYHADDPYKWRNPYGQNVANFSEGHKAKVADDKGNYLYGKKEIKMLQSIETKNYIAEFHYSNREDAYEVINENGGRGGRTLEKLDKIVLYTRCDRGDNGVNAVPLKTVHFEYDYSLCKDLPANSNYVENNGANVEDGKLTLKKIYFTYENSKKGQLSPYEFHYGEGDLNPPYLFRGNDRWGNYKPNNTDLPNTDAPYVDQDNVNDTNIHAAAWSMKQIQLPSGGLINIDLEADDYAYVQDARATRMFQIIGFSDDITPPSANDGRFLYTGDENHLYMHFDAPLYGDVVSGQEVEEFKRQYIGEGTDQIKEVFYKFLMDMTGAGRYQYVSGYAPVAETGWADDKGWIRFEPTGIKDRNASDPIHPIAKTAIQFMRIHLSDFVLEHNVDEDASADNTLNGLVGLMQDVKSLLMGVNKALRTKNVGRRVDLQKSFIRLQTPNYKKLGGGVRVSRIAINDQWEEMSGSDAGNFDYGQTYSYDMVTQDALSSIPVGTTISSGVAVYEPFIGNEENPMRQPNAYTDDRMFAPDNAYYQELPYGEMFFPSPSVGYSQVTVKNLERDGVTCNATGHIVHEFYTGKDFPVKVKTPLLKSKKLPVANLGKLLGTSYVDHKTHSQSYAIELNDMHGKPKAQRVYAEGQEDPISSVKYFYKQDGSTLDNKITVIGKDGIIRREVLAGVDIDMVIDERQSKNFMSTVGTEFNVDVSPIPFLPPVIPLPSVWISASIEDTRFRSIANTKVITRYGILEKTVAEDLGSNVSTENIAWDSETGEVLLTRTENDFEDPIYAFSYPAHWGYDGMGQAYKNIGAELEVYGTNLDDYLVPGDEIITSYFKVGFPTIYTDKVWVKEDLSGGISLVDRDGDAVNINDKMTVIRSGRRNQQSTTIGSITTLSNPIQDDETLLFTDVINAGVVEFKDDWGVPCMCSESINSINPYITGEKGSYRPVRSHAFLTDRNQPNNLGATNIRKDGTFEEFSPFWTPQSGQDWDIDDVQWTFASEVTLVSPYGLELENKDALDRYSAADYKYNNTLPTAVASNSRYREMAFDNFEDYRCTDCKDDHFSFKKSVPEEMNLGADIEIVDTESHTGRRSIKVGAGQTTEVEKIIIPCGSGGEIQ